MRLSRRDFLRGVAGVVAVGDAGNLLPRLGETRAATVDEGFWEPGAVTLEGYWGRMAALTMLPAFAKVEPLPERHRGDPLFGVCNATVADEAIAPLMRGVGATIDRIELRWDEVEPTPGERRFERIDRAFELAERWRLRVLPVLIGAPRWSVRAEARAGAGPPDDWAAWARFAEDVAARYGHRVAGWEVWNEPNIVEFWRGSLAEYARLLRVAYPALSATAPVVLGGMVQDDGAWLRGLLKLDAPFDVVAWHVYGEARELLRLVTIARSMVDRPIWVTEANSPGRDAFPLELFSTARATGVETAMIYRAADIGGHLWGMLREDLEVKPSFLAYRQAALTLSGQ